MSGEIEKDAYLLGTDTEELHRLGLQHQVWLAEAIRGWDRARFGKGATILDLGCGPGFGTIDLAYRVGSEGKLIAVDKSPHYLGFLDHRAKLHGFDIEILQADVHDLDLEPESLDGIWCRWVLAWMDGAREVVRSLGPFLRPGGRIVFHEYYEWGRFAFWPRREGIDRLILACRRSFTETPGDIDVGRHLPEWLAEDGLKVVSVRSMTSVCRPDELTWQWPETFLRSYAPRLVEMGYLTETEAKRGIEEVEELSGMENATLTCPLVVEVIAEKR